MTTDIRAALRAAAAIFDMLANRSEASDYHPLVIPTEYHDAARNFRALADAPPTVAELLPRVDASHVIRFVDRGGDPRMIVRSETGAPMLMGNYGRGGEWLPSELLIEDLAQPATLVEVTP